MTPTRTSLIRRVSDTTDAASWHEFVKLYEPLLLSYVRARGLPHADAGDVVQEIFIRLLRSLPTFALDRQRGRFRTWLYQVTMSVVIDHARARAARDGHVKAWWEQVGKTLSAEEEPGEDWNQAHRRRILEFAHAQVKAQTNVKTWYCYEQRFLHDRPGADIAQE